MRQTKKSYDNHLFKPGYLVTVTPQLRIFLTFLTIFSAQISYKIVC